MIRPTKKIGTVYGAEIPSLQCPDCGFGIGLGGDLDGLPAIFEATCPTCGKTETYRKREIQSPTTVRKQ
jgi:predicted RNA-binding Zn-ribbon protein involved in translation (DUF1610 family)